MLEVERAYEEYRAGRMTYGDYRKNYADPIDEAKSTRFRREYSQKRR